jgi:hypothetical protein
MIVQAYPHEERWRLLSQFLGIPLPKLERVRDELGGLPALREMPTCPFLTAGELATLKAFATLAAMFCVPENLRWGWEEAVAHILAEMGTQEALYTLPLSGTSFLPIRVAQGGVDSVSVTVGEALAHVLRVGAPAFLLAHTHPNGDCTPSPEDLALTQAFVQGSRVLGLSMVDHLVVSPAGIYSIGLAGLVPGLAMAPDPEEALLIPEVIHPGEDLTYACKETEEGRKV